MEAVHWKLRIQRIQDFVNPLITDPDEKCYQFLFLQTASETLKPFHRAMYFASPTRDKSGRRRGWRVYSHRMDRVYQPTMGGGHDWRPTGRTVEFDMPEDIQSLFHVKKFYISKR